MREISPKASYCLKLTMITAMTLYNSCGLPASSSSEVQTLDNFFREDGTAVNRNICRGNFEAVASEQNILANTPTHTAAVKKALTAVPPLLQTAFFRHGKIVVTDDVGKTCQNPQKEQREFASEGGKLEMCWDFQNDGDAILYLADNPSAIQHHMVRGFGYIMAALYGGIVEATTSENQDPETAEAYAQFLANKRALARGLLFELADKDGYDISTRAGLLGANEGLRLNFENFVFAESFDSYFCNAETKASFQGSAPQSYDHFCEMTAKTHGQSCSQLGLTDASSFQPMAASGIAEWSQFSNVSTDTEVPVLQISSIASVRAREKMARETQFGLNWFTDWFYPSSTYAAPVGTAEAGGGFEAAGGIATVLPQNRSRNAYIEALSRSPNSYQGD